MGLNSSVLIVILVFAVLFSLLYVSQELISKDVNSPHVVTVVIPEGSAMATSEHNNFEPAIIKVVMGVNNTVRWVNQDTVLGSVVADNEGDPLFFNITNTDTPNFDANDKSGKNNYLLPGQFFEFTFTKPGEFGYHSIPHPHKHGTVIVLPASGK
jgi:plastocyanin